MRPETLAIRCVNQYRARDIVTYLGLRYYLEATCARPDRWAQEVAADLANHRAAPVYHLSNFYKETSNTGRIEYRELYTPAPNDALAEAALLGECAKIAGPFVSSSSVFSYRLATGDARKGIFEPYFIGYQARHAAIAQVCREVPDAVIIYRDLRRFYPSITRDQAAKAWNEASTTGRLCKTMAQLGETFVHHHRRLPGSHAGMVTGPMFSHLIGNLVLRQLDEEMDRQFPGRYFRYVDDLVIAVNVGEATEAAKKLNEAVERLGFHLHPDKRFDVPAREWLEGEGDLGSDKRRPSWASFIGSMKQMLVSAPGRRLELESRFADTGLRIVPLDYTSATHERDYQASVIGRLKERWFRSKVQQTTPETIVAEGIALRPTMRQVFETACGRLSGSSGFQRRRWLQRLRYACSRLIYLASNDDLITICQALDSIPEVAEYAAIFRALHCRDVGPMLLYGGRVAQAAAQPLKSLRQPVACSRAEVDWPAASLEALAVLLMNGLKVVVAETSPPPPRPILKFARGESPNSHDKSDGADYFAELCTLHGFTQPSRHVETLAAAFDVDESLVFDSQSLQAYS